MWPAPDTREAADGWEAADIPPAPDTASALDTTLGLDTTLALDTSGAGRAATVAAPGATHRECWTPRAPAQARNRGAAGRSSRSHPRATDGWEAGAPRAGAVGPVAASADRAAAARWCAAHRRFRECRTQCRSRPHPAPMHCRPYRFVPDRAAPCRWCVHADPFRQRAAGSGTFLRPARGRPSSHCAERSAGWGRMTG
jgi:hypothetical protein